MQGIEWQNVGKRFGAVQVVDDFSLQVAAGEFVALLGPSGCGKSTLLRMLAGLEPVSSGRVHVAGRDVTALPPGQRGLAMVFQQYALYPHMTVHDNLAFGLRNIGTAEAEITRRVQAAAAMLELSPLLQRKPAQLSGGQRQRVAIGRAVVKEPQALLLDEPMSNLDAALRGRTRVELARLHKRLGATMLLVTHDQIEAMTLADRIVVMNQGRIEQVGTPMDTYRRPASRFVAGFVGSPAMNFLPLQRLPAAGGLARFGLPGGGVLDAGMPLPDTGAAADGWVLGLRAEALRPAATGLLQGTVEVVERLGDRTLVHATLADGTLLVADAGPAAEPAVGEALAFDFAPAAAHFFDAGGRAHRLAGAPLH